MLYLTPFCASRSSVGDSWTAKRACSPKAEVVDQYDHHVGCTARCRDIKMRWWCHVARVELGVDRTLRLLYRQYRAVDVVGLRAGCRFVPIPLPLAAFRPSDLNLSQNLTVVFIDFSLLYIPFSTIIHPVVSGPMLLAESEPTPSAVATWRGPIVNVPSMFFMFLPFFLVFSWLLYFPLLF